MLAVHVPPAASGAENEQVVPVMLYSPPKFSESDSAVICRGPVPELVMVTVLVTGARGVGMVNVSVLTPITVPRVPFVAAVKETLPVPVAIPVPVRATGEPVTAAPVKATVRVRFNDPVAVGWKTTL